MSDYDNIPLDHDPQARIAWHQWERWDHPPPSFGEPLGSDKRVWDLSEKPFPLRGIDMMMTRLSRLVAAE